MADKPIANCHMAKRYPPRLRFPPIDIFSLYPADLEKLIAYW